MPRALAALLCLFLCLCLAAQSSAADADKKGKASALMQKERRQELNKLAKERKQAKSSPRAEKNGVKPGRPQIQKLAGAKNSASKTSPKKKASTKGPASKKKKTEASAANKIALAAKKEAAKKEEPRAEDLVVRPAEGVELWQGEFGRGPVRLYLWPDHFFALLLGGEKPRSITGIWSQSGDGVRLDLANAQDLAIGISRGKKRLYASFGDLDWGSGELLRAGMKEPPVFEAAGKLDKNGFRDAASGRSFSVAPEAVAGLPLDNPVFATARISNGVVDKILRHSRQFPRTLESMGGNGGVARKTAFRDNALQRHWRLPPMPGAEQAVLLFLPEREPSGNDEEMRGDVEISGPGIRAEGTFMVAGDRLVIKLDDESLRNLEAVGAPELGRAVNGDFTWSADGGALTLKGGDGPLRLLGQ